MAFLVVEWGGWGLGAPKYCLQQSVISFWSTVSGQPPSKCWKGWRSSGFSFFLSSWLDYLALVLVVHVSSSWVAILSNMKGFALSPLILQILRSYSLLSWMAELAWDCYWSSWLSWQCSLHKYYLGAVESSYSAIREPEPATPPCLWWPFWWWNGVDGA